VPPCVGARPFWACLSGLALGGRTSLPPRKESGTATCRQGGDRRAGPTMCSWQKDLLGTPANYRI
jgi:hypothetical protein